MAKSGRKLRKNNKISQKQPKMQQKWLKMSNTNQEIPSSSCISLHRPASKVLAIRPSTLKTHSLPDKPLTLTLSLSSE